MRRSFAEREECGRRRSIEGDSDIEPYCHTTSHMTCKEHQETNYRGNHKSQKSTNPE